mmetsp:Transcript_11602/g.28143  ORF Transcript_11602/g.28143 Transcript_11602/m.28143 type:complete len:223 (+) Transcript_11602:516-1184(+)
MVSRPEIARNDEGVCLPYPWLFDGHVDRCHDHRHVGLGVVHGDLDVLDRVGHVAGGAAITPEPCHHLAGNRNAEVGFEDRLDRRKLHQQIQIVHQDVFGTRGARRVGPGHRCPQWLRLGGAEDREGVRVHQPWLGDGVFDEDEREGRVSEVENVFEHRPPEPLEVVGGARDRGRRDHRGGRHPVRTRRDGRVAVGLILVGLFHRVPADRAGAGDEHGFDERG